MINAAPLPPVAGRDLEERTVSHQVVHAGSFLTVRQDHILGPDDKPGSREFIVHPGAVMILPMMDEQRVIIERQFRYPLRRTFLEFPAGKRDPGEDVLTCARRELLEETGYVAANWLYLGSIHNAIAYADERIDLFLARQLDFKGAKLDEGEHLEVLTVAWQDVLQWSSNGLITDVKTIIGVHWLALYLQGDWQPPGLEALAVLERLDKLAKATLPCIAD